MFLPIKPGDFVDGKYVIESVIGVGGMGAVFLAYHEQLRRRVAIKFLLNEAKENPDAYARFEREAHAAAALQSENVTRVIDLGALPDGTPYIVMEYLEGQDLSARLASVGRLPIEEAVAHVLEVCDALSEAHALGIVHRDLKPANLFLAQRANGSTRVKVLDFGISKMGASGIGKQMSLTGTGAVMGSPLYMSPEQLRGSGKVDERTDIWALGVVLYEFLAGRPPFQAEAFPEQCALILTAPAPPLREHRPDVPPALEAIVMRCLAKDVNVRFSNVGELTAALLGMGAQADLSASARLGLPLQPPTVRNAVVAPMDLTLQVPPQVPAPVQYGTSTSMPVSRAEVPMKSSRLSLGLGIVLGIGVLSGLAGTFLLTRSRQASENAGPPAAAASAPGVNSSPEATPIPPPQAPVEPQTGVASPSPPPVAPGAPGATAPSTSAVSTSAASPAHPPSPHQKGHAPAPSPPSGRTSPAPNPPPPAPAPPAPAAAAPAAPDCSTPYYFDSQGNKVFKPDCLK
jgi:eukaryotic-like serine/threonine-protein kinase